MPTLAPAPLAESSSAERTAELNWMLNYDALCQTQPAMAELWNAVQFGHEWIYARDGSITAMQPNGRWWADCSVPLLASRALLKSLEEGSVGSCLLSPGNAGMVRAARERMGPWAVLFVVQPDAEVMRIILACHDFSSQIAEHRIWFLTGEDWSQQLRQILNEHPGLATPTRFIRTKLTSDELINPMITEAQAVFSSVLMERGEIISQIKAEHITSADSKSILHVGGTEFRLWDFGAAVLQQQLAGTPVQRFDTDDALSGSPIALLKAVQDCGSIVAANLCRVDSNQLVPADVPWVTWITQPSVPAFETASRLDGLVLADAAWRGIARNAGWPEDRVRVCGWPQLGINPDRAEMQPVLGLLCDTQAIQIPGSVKDFSSHRLLWDLIEEEMAADPLVVEEIDAYLEDRAQQLNIKNEALDRRAFIEHLILPAYQQGLARLLIRAGVAISVFGKGWTDLPEFAAYSRGEVSDEESFEAAVGDCSGLIYCWPARAAHAIDSVGKPVVYRSGRDSAQLIRNARRVLAGSGRKAPTANNFDISLRKAILELLNIN